MEFRYSPQAAVSLVLPFVRFALQALPCIYLFRARRRPRHSSGKLVCGESSLQTNGVRYLQIERFDRADARGMVRQQANLLYT